MFINLMPFSVEATGEDKDDFIMVPLRESGESQVNYPLTIKIYDGLDEDNNPKYKVKTFDSEDEVLGYNLNGSRSNWAYKTYRTVFFGWTTAGPDLGGNIIIPGTIDFYRDNEPISSVKNLSENTILYPIDLGEAGILALAGLLKTNAGSFNISRYDNPEDVLPDSTIKHKNNATTWENTPNIERRVTAYYEEGREKYAVTSSADFTYSDLRVPAAAIENPLGTVKSAKGITDFSGGDSNSPKSYSYEDLLVDLDENVDVNTVQNNWTFSSSTFMVAAILDENYNVLPASITQPNHTNLISTFSFNLPENAKKFIIRTVPRNDIGNGKYDNEGLPSNNILTAKGSDLQSPMILKTNNSQNITVSKELALKLAKDSNSDLKELNFFGKIAGNLAFNKSQYPHPFNLFVPNNSEIKLTEASNHLYIDFAIPLARFDKNTKDLGDFEEQNLGYSIFALNGSFKNDEFNLDSEPNLDSENPGDAFYKGFDLGKKYNINGKELVFKGWNTKADGSGEFVTEDSQVTASMLNQNGNSEVKEDMTLYAIWENSSIKLEFNENHPKGQIKKYDLKEGEEVEKYFYNPSREGYEFIGWNLKSDGSGDYLIGNEKIYNNTTVYAIWKEVTFAGLTNHHTHGENYYSIPKEYEIHKAYIEGYPDLTVKAEGNITRAEAAAMVLRLENSDFVKDYGVKFDDVEGNAWYLPYVNEAVKSDMLVANENKLRPDSPITRAEFARMLAPVDPKNEAIAKFSDIKDHIYEKAINQAYGNMRIEGYKDGSFRPDSPITRAEIVTILNRKYNRLVDERGLVESYKYQVVNFVDLDKNDWFYYEILEASNSHEYFRRGDKDYFGRNFEEWTKIIESKINKR